MAKISLCMIVRDEEAVLERCLKSVCPAVDEIIIADTGSKDSTKKIAAQFTEQIYDYTWKEDFADARNFVFSKAGMDYQMWMDADDVLEDAEALSRLKEGLTADVVMLPYHVAFDENGQPTVSYYRERLLKRSRHFQWEGAVHEVITPTGEILYGTPAILHKKEHTGDPDRNLRIYQKLIDSGKVFTARELYYYARELYYHKQYASAKAAFLHFLTKDGWIEDNIGTCLLLSRCCQAIGETEEAAAALFRSFRYGLPRAEICCEIGKLFFEKENFTEAIFWYQAAISAPVSTGGFIEPDCHDYIPYLQLCVCYDRIGNLSKAAAYNERAGRIRPSSPAFLANRTYFRQKGIH